MVVLSFATVAHGLFTDFRVDFVQDSFADFAKVDLCGVYQAAFCVVLEVFFMVF